VTRSSVWGTTCVLVGLGFLFTAARIFVRRKRFLATAAPTQARVVSVRVDGIGRNQVRIPTFEFRLPNGSLQRAESTIGSGFHGQQVGDVVSIWYDPADPTQAEGTSFGALWGLAVLRAGFALVFLLMGAVALVFQPF
jgi:uncharacterized protein DUF3592